MIRDGLKTLLERLRREHASFALTAGEHLLTSFSNDEAEVGLLPLAIESAARFFPLSGGDVVLLKDPAVGGPGRDRLAIVTCWRAGDDANPPLRAATTISHPALRTLRLPPAPLRFGGELNPGVIEALGPVREAVFAAEAALRASGARFARPAIAALVSKKAMQDLAIRERDAWKARLEELPEGEAEAEATLPSGETLRARLINDGKRLSIDLSGTTAPRDLRVPLAATSGWIWSGLRDRLQLGSALDSFTPTFLPLLVPNGCFLNAMNGDCDRGLEEAGAWVHWVIELLIQRWDRRRSNGLVNPFDLKAELRFSPEREWKLHLPAGSPALEEEEGTVFWRQRTGTGETSLEALEKEWPVRVLRVDERVLPLGKGRIAGGRGLHFQIETREPAHLRWFSPGPAGRVKTEKNQTPFEVAQVLVHRDGTEQSIPAGATFALQPGDQITFLSGSGGGRLAAEKTN